MIGIKKDDDILQVRIENLEDQISTLETELETELEKERPNLSRVAAIRGQINSRNTTLNGLK